MDSLPLYSAALNSTFTVLLSSLVTLPLSLWLIPYMAVSRAGFYDHLCQLGPVDSEQMPSL